MKRDEKVRKKINFTDCKPFKSVNKLIISFHALFTYRCR